MQSFAAKMIKQYSGRQICSLRSFCIHRCRSSSFSLVFAYFQGSQRPPFFTRRDLSGLWMITFSVGFHSLWLVAISSLWIGYRYLFMLMTVLCDTQWHILVVPFSSYHQPISLTMSFHKSIVIYSVKLDLSALFRRYRNILCPCQRY